MTACDVIGLEVCRLCSHPAHDGPCLCVTWGPVGRTALPFDEIAPVAHGDVEVDDRDGQLDYDEDVADHQGRGDVTENVVVIGDDQ